MEFDDVLVLVGEFGKAQIILYVLLGVVGWPCGMQNLAMVFLGAKLDHVCVVPELDIDGLSIKQQLDIISPMKKASGGSGIIAPDMCARYNSSVPYGDFSEEDLISWNSSLTEGMGHMSCDEWNYDTSTFTITVVNRWDLVCDNAFIRPLMQSVYMCGFLAGAFVYGIVSDKIGRLKTMTLCLAKVVVCGTSAALAFRYSHYALFMAIRFFSGMAAAGAFTSGFVLVMETIAPRHRTKTGIFWQGWFAVGFCLTALLAFLIRDMFYLQLAMACPTAVLLVYYWILPESPRWLVHNGEVDRAKDILQRIAKINGRTLPADLRFDSESKSQEDLAMDNRGTFIDMFRTRNMLIRTAIVSYNWMVNGLVYYGLSYSGDALGGDIFVNTLVSGLIEFPAYLFCFYACNHPKIGRRYSSVIGLLLGGVGCLACIPLLNNKDLTVPLVILANIGKFGISASFAIIYIYTAEIFPTVIRNVAVGTGSTWARVGALLAPQVMLANESWYGTAYLIFGVLAVIASGTILLLPESLNKVLPETLEDGELFGTKGYDERHAQKLENSFGGHTNDGINNDDLYNKKSQNTTF